MQTEHQLKQQDSLPARKSIADTISAIASAVAAIGSAVAAFIALTVATQQKDVSVRQLQATYLANLYTKQLDGTTQIESGISNLWLLAQRDKLYNSTISDEAQGIKFQDLFKAHLSEYMQAQYELGKAADALSLVMPSSAEMRLRMRSTAAAGIRAVVEEFIGAPYSSDSKDRFVSYATYQLHFLVE